MSPIPELTRARWREAGVLNARGEFTQWVHIWSVNPVGWPITVITHAALPWIRPYGMERPSREGIASAYHLDGCQSWPENWEHIAIWLALPESPYMRTSPVGPSGCWYWHVFPSNGRHHLDEFLRRLEIPAGRPTMAALEPYLIVSESTRRANQ